MSEGAKGSAGPQDGCMTSASVTSGRRDGRESSGVTFRVRRGRTGREPDQTAQQQIGEGAEYGPNLLPEEGPIVRTRWQGPVELDGAQAVAGINPRSCSVSTGNT